MTKDVVENTLIDAKVLGELREGLAGGVVTHLLLDAGLLMAYDTPL